MRHLRTSDHRAEESKCYINRMSERETVVGLPWAADSCPGVEKVRTVLPSSDVIRDSAVQLGLTHSACGGWGVCVTVVSVQERALAAVGMIASYADPNTTNKWGEPPQRMPACFTGYYRAELAEAGVLKLALATQVRAQCPVCKVAPNRVLIGTHWPPIGTHLSGGFGTVTSPLFAPLLNATRTPRGARDGLTGPSPAETLAPNPTPRL
jgi:hypothetical protein